MSASKRTASEQEMIHSPLQIHFDGCDAGWIAFHVAVGNQMLDLKMSHGLESWLAQENSTSQGSWTKWLTPDDTSHCDVSFKPSQQCRPP